MPMSLSCSFHGHVPLPPCPGRFWPRPVPEEASSHPGLPEHPFSGPSGACRFVMTMDCVPGLPTPGNLSHLGTAASAEGKPQAQPGQGKLTPSLAPPQPSVSPPGPGGRAGGEPLCLLLVSGGLPPAGRLLWHRTGVPQIHVLHSPRCEQQRKFLCYKRQSSAAAQSSPPPIAHCAGSDTAYNIT